MPDEWSLENCIQNGCLPTGEPIEALYGVGYWSDMGNDEPRVCQCPKCETGRAFELSDGIDCENCGFVGEVELRSLTKRAVDLPLGA
jgi:hypothetical protein